MAFSGILRSLLRDKVIGKRVVPIIPDEARTFGMDALFSEVKIYSPHGQTYEAADHKMLLSYKESEQGQILHEGITEAGAMASMIAAGTAYATHSEQMIPVYIFYSMFGFQRTGDQMWALGDQLGRGFLLGATAGRTTLTGEGLQHNDGHSVLLASVSPACVSYDAAWRAGEDEGSDTRLIRYLWKNHHTTPFEAVSFTFEIKAPIFVFRQWHRHRT